MGDFGIMGDFWIMGDFELWMNFDGFTANVMQQQQQQ